MLQSCLLYFTDYAVTVETKQTGKGIAGFQLFQKISVAQPHEATENNNKTKLNIIANRYVTNPVLPNSS